MVYYSPSAAGVHNATTKTCTDRHRECDTCKSWWAPVMHIWRLLDIGQRVKTAKGSWYASFQFDMIQRFSWTNLKAHLCTHFDYGRLTKSHINRPKAAHQLHRTSFARPKLFFLRLGSLNYLLFGKALWHLIRWRFSCTEHLRVQRICVSNITMERFSPRELC